MKGELQQKKAKGITLIALVITIIVLLILAGVTIATLTGDNGIITKAIKSKEIKTEADAIERVKIEVAGSYRTDGNIDIESLQANLRNIKGLESVEVSSLPKVINVDNNIIVIENNGNVIAGDLLENAIANKTIYSKNTMLIDKYNNKIMIPAGFKVDSTSPDSVAEGVVIEDATYVNTIGSQFVWIPVGKVNNIEKIETITLERYTFANDGRPSVYSGNFTEDTVENHKNEYGNKIAKDIEDFKTKAINSNGYWIGRYEARKENENVVCKYDKSIYNRVIQSQASALSQNMYKDTSFTSDLINSYAWDTAIIFIQTFSGDTDYSRQKHRTNGGWKNL